MTPTFSNFFKSSYYSTTYLPPRNLSEQKLSNCLLETEDKKTAEKAQQLLSDPEIQSVMSEPLSYDLVQDIPKKNAILTEHGFTLLGSKTNLLTDEISRYYSVVEHKELPGWVIKSGATKVSEKKFVLGPMNDRNEMAFFAKEEGILRLSMAARIAKVAKEAKIEIVIPKKKLVSYRNVDGITDVTRKYCVLCEKIDVLSPEETIDTIKKMGADQQIEVARKISRIVKESGLVDASFHSIRLTPEGKLAFIDTEPTGLMVAGKSDLWSKLFGKKGASVEKCIRIGLFTLMSQATKANHGQTAKTGLEKFHKQIKNDYEKVVSPKLSKWKICLSVLSLGLVPLINVIVALVKTKLVKRCFEKLKKMNASFLEKVRAYSKEKVPEISTLSLQKEKFVEKHEKKRLLVIQQFYAYTEGVPYKAVLV